MATKKASATKKTSKYTQVSTKPVKRFFVDMLVRDIALEDAILDLLDNCIDGVQRTIDNKTRASESPYKGFHAHIKLDTSQFSISDNCGGIPWSEHGRAFRMGQPAIQSAKVETPAALLVGVYGIGMKRAIFKMGTEATILTRAGADEYEVSIPPGWTDDQDNWDLEAEEKKGGLSTSGTRIEIRRLTAATSGRFSSEEFVEILTEKIATHYSIILSKGFVVTLNGAKVSPRRIAVKFQEKADDGASIRPYIFKSPAGSAVEVFVAVGLRDAIPDAETTLEAQEEPKLSTDYAGWTIVCNDRVVLYCNRDELTGWGTANIPRYHTQFIAISGIVEFKGDPRSLPTTTTKRGLEFSSVLYQQVLNRMRDGTRMFIDFTNWWKQNEPQIKQQMMPMPAKTLLELKVATKALSFNSTKTGLKGEIFLPKLPRPAAEVAELRIAFYRPRKRVMKLAEALFEDFDEMSEKECAKAVGEHLFDDAVKLYKIKG